MNVKAMIEKYALNPKGVIQAGSHHGEEIPLWDSMGIPSVHFEPVTENFHRLLKDHPHARAFPFALGSEKMKRSIYLETVNGGQSCSILTPKKHLELLPWIEFTGSQEIVVVTLDDPAFNWSAFNFMYVDVQGYELELFKGAAKTLAGIEFIFTEVNRAEVFQDCARIEDLDEFLGSHGFKRVETEWHGIDFGDALYVRA